MSTKYVNSGARDRAAAERSWDDVFAAMRHDPAEVWTELAAQREAEEVEQLLLNRTDDR
jgi:hypothetical protein